MTSETDAILLTPSATLVPDELRLDVGPVPSGMVPLSGEPILEHIADSYESIGVSNVVAVGEAGDLIRDYTHRSTHDWTVVDVGQTSSVGETVLETLRTLDAERLAEATLYINYADTLVKPIRVIDDTDYVAFKKTDRTYRWTTFVHQDGEIDQITPKYSSTDTGSRPTFIGQFGISDPTKFREVLQSTADDVAGDLDLFYTSLLSYLQTSNYALHEPELWLDVGHLDTFYRAKKEFLNTREFNHLTTGSKNVITKRSDDVEKLINEIEWYNQVPTELQPYLPRLYNWSTDEQDPYMRMEYIGYPSLSDLQLYGAHGNHIWNRVFHRLFEMLEEFWGFEADASATEIRTSLKQMYLSKTRDRLDDLSQSGVLTEFFGGTEIRVNGRSYPTIDEILDRLDDIVAENGLLDVDTFSVIHGDLCFPNVMYDSRNEIIKLIDPRGEFGTFRVHGDPRYDVAKLRHSVVGHYEHLINGQFRVSCDPDSATIDYEIYTTEDQEVRESHFDSLLVSRTLFDLQQTKLIEALLFLSMVPLHADCRPRQQCMLALGVEKISPYVE